MTLNNQKYLVGVRCYTYNHALYIKEALNGFCMQETNFPYVCTIFDDASTDGEQEEIRNYLAEHFEAPFRTVDTEYANIIFSRHKTNKNCDFIVFLLKYNHYSIKKPKLQYLSELQLDFKYVAFCEGDDYWCDTLKLQKQAEFMESHSDYVLCVHETKLIRYIDGENNKINSSDLPQTLFLNITYDLDASAEDMILTKVWPHFSSLMIRNSIWPIPKCFYVQESADWQLLMYASMTGKVRLMKDVMSVYRQGVEGSYTQRMRTNVAAKILHHQHKAEMLKKVMKEYPQYTKYLKEALYKNNKQLCRISSDNSYMSEFSTFYRFSLSIKNLGRRIKRKFLK